MQNKQPTTNYNAYYSSLVSLKFPFLYTKPDGQQTDKSELPMTQLCFQSFGGQQMVD